MKSNGKMKFSIQFNKIIDLNDERKPHFFIVRNSMSPLENRKTKTALRSV